MMYWIGIDVAKRKHDIVVLDESGQPVGKPLTIRNNREGIDTLIATLRALDGQVQIALEATGHYWLSLYEQLSKASFDVLVLNPLQVHAYSRSGIRRAKTDKRDAFWVADFLRIGGARPSRVPETTYLQIRDLGRFRFGLIDDIGDCKRKLLSILDRVFPEYETLFSSVFLRSSRELLKKTTNPQEFASFDLAELSNLLRSASHGRFGTDKAKRIIETARDSIGITVLMDAGKLQVQCLLAQIEFLETQVVQVDEAIRQLMDTIPQYITSIPGIGPVTGAVILGEIGDVLRFSELEKLVAYAGIDPTVHHSGQFEGTKAHMSKRGSPYLRRALWLSASVARLHDPQLKAYYDKRKVEGKHHGQIMGALCRKLLARVYVVLKENRPYELR